MPFEFGSGKQVPGEPDATDVEQREDAGAHHREDRHGLGCAIDGRAPLLAQQAEDGGDQRAGVADADPEDEVDDGPAPVDRAAVTPHADAGADQIGEAGDRKRGDKGRRRRSRPTTTSASAPR